MKTYDFIKYIDNMNKSDEFDFATYDSFVEDFLTSANKKLKTGVEPSDLYFVVMAGLFYSKKGDDVDFFADGSYTVISDFIDRLLIEHIN